jgi:cardiolipin synthase
MLGAIDRRAAASAFAATSLTGWLGADFVTRLKAASVRGVEVCIILDALGERYSRVKARKLLAGSGIKFRLYLPLSRGLFINLRNHRKLLIVDGREAFTGGMNIRNPQPPLQMDMKLGSGICFSAYWPCGNRPSAFLSKTGFCYR